MILTLGSFQAKSDPNVLDLKYTIEDSSIVYPESFETDTRKLMEGWYLKNYTSADTRASSTTDPGASTETIRRRLAALPTVIDLPCNSIVVNYIERYTKKGRPQLAAILGLANYYMPIFEQALEEAGLPLELKYLPVIESALNPNAVSKHGAAGLWQFIIASAKGYDMEVSSLVDERRDPYISSNRACRFLRNLYDAYGDWSLAIAAYNCGPGTVNKALARAGGDPKSHDFWSIYYLLPEETRGYVPMFIAANYVMNYYPEHNISPVLPTKPLVTDTIHVSDRVHFDQICAVLDIPADELRILNPQFRADIIPGSKEHPYNLVLPSQQTRAYLISQQQILDYERDKYARKIDATPAGDPQTAVVEETALLAENVDTEPLNPADLAPAEEAAAGETYATARRRRGSDRTPTATDAAAAKSTADVSSSSSPAKNSASTGSNSSSSKTTTKNSTAAKKTPAAPTSHTVKSGENLTVIAKKYGVSVQDLQKANPTVKDGKIKPNQKLNLPAKKSTASKSTSKKKRK